MDQENYFDTLKTLQCSINLKSLITVIDDLPRDNLKLKSNADAAELMYYIKSKNSSIFISKVVSLRAAKR